jgi:hypothetical protein
VEERMKRERGRWEAEMEGCLEEVGRWRGEAERW